MKLDFRFIFFSHYFLMNFSLYSNGSISRFDNDLNKYSKMHIKEIVVLGERGSGTKALYQLLDTCIEDCLVLGGCLCLSLDSFEKRKDSHYHHKHFYPWLDLSRFGYHLEKSNYDKNYLNGTQSTLYIFIVRDVYDWVRSFFQNGHHVGYKELYMQMSKIKSKRNQFFMRFISRTWLSDPGIPNLIDGYNPYENRPFKNIFELRKLKNLNYLQIGSLVDNFIVIRSEELRSYPGSFIQFIKNRYNIKVSKTPKDRKIKRPMYFRIGKTAFKFIQQEVDWEVENMIGYQKRAYNDFLWSD